MGEKEAASPSGERKSGSIISADYGAESDAGPGGGGAMGLAVSDEGSPGIKTPPKK